MNIVCAGFKILTEITQSEMIKSIESKGRVCYKSENKSTDQVSEEFVLNLIKKGHESVLEHSIVSVLITCDRGISHELVRHRIASYSQESTRFCNYGKEGSVSFIKPVFWDEKDKKFELWKRTMKMLEDTYLYLIEQGSSPQEARSVLPTSLKTEIVVTMNIRQWRYFFKIRALGIAGKPHPQMLEITIPLLKEFQRRFPVLFSKLL